MTAKVLQIPASKLSTKDLLASSYVKPTAAPAAPHNVYITKSGDRMRLINNSLLIAVDPLPKVTKGGIFIPDQSCDSVYNTGVVVATGFVTSQTAEKLPIPGIAVGDRVMFIRFLAKQDSNLQLIATVGEEVIRARASDILLIFGDEDLVKFRPDLAP